MKFYAQKKNHYWLTRPKLAREHIDIEYRGFFFYILCVGVCRFLIARFFVLYTEVSCGWAEVRSFTLLAILSIITVLGALVFETS